MHKLIKEILNKIENNGFEAYIIGGYVRDLLLGKSSFDVDICTNATPKELIMLFPNSCTKNLGGIDFKIQEYNFEITTYREEIKYSKRKPIEFNYINNLIEDLNRRDFTINSICMNKKGEIIDILNGTEDIQDLKIKMIGSPKKKLTEDPLRILRALRLATVLDFTLDSELYKEILEQKKLILTLSKTRIKEEFDKILISKNVTKGLRLLENIGILKLLGITYNEVVPVQNTLAMYAQIDFTFDFPFSKLEKEDILKLRTIIKSNEITDYTLYNYGLYICGLASYILNIDINEINKRYHNLPIKELKSIAISPKEIVEILNIDYSKKISLIYKELENNIISGKIINKHEYIVKYLENNKERWQS